MQQADASYTNESGVVCAVMTADCLPLLVCSTDGAQVAAIHAGWRGLLAGVISNTVVAMQIPSIPRFDMLRTGFFKGGSQPAPQYRSRFPPL